MNTSYNTSAMQDISNIPPIIPLEDVLRKHTAEEYLRILYGGIPNGYIHLWIKDENTKRSLFFKTADIERAAETATNLAIDHDVYLGTGLRREDYGPYKRGGAEDISHITCLTLDVDLTSPVHKEKNLPEDIATVERILLDLPPWSLMVRSGHGLYPVWLLEEPWAIEDDQSREKIQTVMNKFHNAAALLFKLHGYNIDNVSDLARVLRLPGTYNHKLEPILVDYNYYDHRYSADQLLVAAEDIISKFNNEALMNLLNKKGNEPQAIPEATYPVKGDVDAELIVSRCEFINHCFKDAQFLPEIHWYYGLVSIISRAHEGREWVHRLSSPYPGYSKKETDNKIDHALRNAGPTTCSVIEEKCGGEYCSGCRFKGHISSPIRLGVSPSLPGASTVQGFPIETLPAAIREYAVDSARSIGCPVDFLAVLLLVISGGLIGTTHNIIVKSGWQESAGLYAGIVAAPASKKSPALRAATRFLNEIVQGLMNEYDEEKAEYAIQKEQWETAMEEWRRDRTEEKPVEPKEPKLPRLFTVDTTVEALASLMADNPKGIGIYRDELSAWYNSLNSYKGGSGSDKEFFLQSHSGNSYVVDRKGKEPIVIDKTFLAIAGCLTPDVIGELIIKSSVADGFLERLLFAYPDPVQHRWTDFTVSGKVIDAARNIFQRLYEIRTLADPSEPVGINLNDTQRLFSSWYDQTHIEMESGGFPKTLQGSWGKLPGNCARIILILHLWQMAAQPETGLLVSDKTIQNGIAIAEYFKNHYRKIYNFQDTDNAVYADKIQKVIAWMQRKQEPFCTARDLQSAKVGKMNAAEAKTVLNMMVDYGLGIWSTGEQKMYISF